MKHFVAVIVLLMTCVASIDGLAAGTSQALSDFRTLIQPTETAAGFHSLEMPKLREFSDSVPVTVDEKCLRFAIVTGNGDKELCREHGDIKKLVIVPLKDDWYGKSFPGDYLVMVHYRGVGKLILLSLDAANVDPFISAVRILSPSLKKVKDKR